MIQSEIIQRVLQIKVGENLGTAFTIEVGNKQYLVSAKHIFENFNNQEKIEILIRKNKSKWMKTKIKLHFHDNAIIDIAVLSLLNTSYIIPVFSNVNSSAGIAIGQDVFFLGFPYNIFIDSKELNNGFPFPLVKKCFLSGIDFNEGVQYFYLDGHNNPGFSGGPLSFKKKGKQLTQFVQ